MNDVDFYGVVTLNETDSARTFDIVGKAGVVLGMAEGEQGDFTYAVSVDGVTYSVVRSDFTATGRKMSREDIYDGFSVRVSPEGEICFFRPSSG